MAFYYFAINNLHACCYRVQSVFKTACFNHSHIPPYLDGGDPCLPRRSRKAAKAGTRQAQHPLATTDAR